MEAWWEQKEHADCKLDPIICQVNGFFYKNVQISTSTVIFLLFLLNKGSIVLKVKSQLERSYKLGCDRNTCTFGRFIFAYGHILRKSQKLIPQIYNLPLERVYLCNSCSKSEGRISYTTVAGCKSHYKIINSFDIALLHLL